MRLSDFFQNVIRDAEFDSIGKLYMRPNNRMLSFAENEKFLKGALNNPDIVAIVTIKELAELVPDHYGLVIDDIPRKALWETHNHLSRTEAYIGQRFASVIPDSCHIHPTAIISPFNVVLGERVTIEQFVTIDEGVTIGDDSVIRANTILGGQDFEFAHTGDSMTSIKFCGKINIGANVEIQQSCFAGRAIFPYLATTIADNVRIGSLSNIGETCHIGRNTLIATQCTFGGSVTIGDNVWIGPNGTVSDTLCIGDNARVTIGSTVLSNVAAGETVSGHPAVKHEIYLQHCLALQRLGKKLRGAAK